MKDLNAINLDKLLGDDDDVDDDENLDDLEDELECLNTEAKHEEPQAAPKKPINSGNSDTTKLKGLQDNLNSFKKKMTDAAQANDSNKQRRFKRVCDVG